MTEEWKALNDQQKEEYVGLSNREKARYDQEMRIFKDRQAKE